MKKTPISAYDPANGQDSPEAATIIPAEFSVDGTSARITLTQTPVVDTKILIVRKIGKKWQTGTDPLSQTKNDIARFLRQKEVAMPQ